MKAEELINWSVLSSTLTGSKTTLQKNRIPKKHQKTINQKLLFIFIGILFCGCTKKDGLENTCKTCTTTITKTYYPTRTEVRTLCDGEWKSVDGKKTTVQTKEGIWFVWITSTTVCK